LGLGQRDDGLLDSSTDTKVFWPDGSSITVMERACAVSICLLVFSLVLVVAVDPRPALGVKLWSPPLGTRTSIFLSGNLSELVVDPIRSRAYAADRMNNRVYALDLDNGSVLASIPVREGPTALAIPPSGDILYVGHGSNRSIMAVNLNSLAVVRTFETTFLTWEMVAPDALTLVVTTHDDQWSGDGPYVLNASNGGIVQRLCSHPLVCNKFYQDTLVATSPDRSWLMLADSLLCPTALYSYQRGVNGTWPLVDNNRGPGWGLGCRARDLAFSPDNQYLYLATAGTSLLKLWTSDFTLVRTFGSIRESSAVVVSSSGDRVAMSAGDKAIHVFDNVGTPLWSITMTAPVTRLRLTANGDRFVAIAGESTVEVVSSSPPSPPSMPLSGVTRTWLLYAALTATTTEGLVLAVLALRQRRRAP